MSDNLKRTSSISSFINKMRSNPSSKRGSPEPEQDKKNDGGLFTFGKRPRPESSHEHSSDSDHHRHHGSDYSSDDEEEEEEDEHLDTDKHVNKRQRRTSEAARQAQAEEDEKIAAREAELDAELEPQYRKFRPRGFRFNVPPQDRKVRVYADGVFDLFHLGHMKQLEQAKVALPNATLVCGIPSDKETHRHKGLTVLSDYQRAESLRHCRWVDEVVEDAPWVVTPEFLKKHKIDYVAHDDLPYAGAGNDDIYKPLKEKGMFLTTQRTEGISTSDIITKIIRDYDKYLMRNFARGASRKDLNVSWLKKNELDLKRHVLQFRESFKTGVENVKNRDIYSEVMGYMANHLTPNKRKKKVAGKASSASPSLNGEPKSDSPRRPQSPATEFAANYSGGSFFGNVKGWVSRKMDNFDSAPPSASISPSPDPASPEHQEQKEQNASLKA